MTLVSAVQLDNKMYCSKLPRMLLLAPLLLAGCSSTTGPDGPEAPKTTKVGGVLLIDGEPAPLGVVELKLYPKGGDLKPGMRVPKCLVRPEGRFDFSSYASGDGAEPGEYVLSIEMLRMAPGELFGPDQFGNNFNSPFNEDPRFHVTVGEDDPVEIPTIDLDTSQLEYREHHPFASPPGKRR